MNINKDAFLFAYQQEEFGALSVDQAAGLTQLLTFLQNDPDMMDVRWVAYYLRVPGLDRYSAIWHLDRILIFSWHACIKGGIEDEYKQRIHI